MAKVGGLGGLGGIDLGGFDPGDILGAIGQSLLVSPRTAPLAGLPAAIQAVNRSNDEEMKRGATETALRKYGIDPETAKSLSWNPQAAALWVTGDNAQKDRALSESAMKGVGGLVPPDLSAPTAPSPASPIQGRPGSLAGLGGMPSSAPAAEGGGAATASAPAVQSAPPGARDGSRSWRNNNPGNIEYGPYARSMGATGSDGRFAIFPDYQTGRGAQEKLLFEGRNYRDLTLGQAIRRWAPASENDVPAYIGAMGGDSGKRMSEYSPEERVRLLDAMQRHEGWRPGAGAPRPAAVAGGAAQPAAPRTDGVDPASLDYTNGRFTLNGHVTQPNPAAGINYTNGRFTRVGPDPAAPAPVQAGNPAAPAVPGPAAAQDGTPAPYQVAASGGKIPVPRGNIQLPPPKPNVGENTMTMKAWARSSYTRGLQMVIAGGARGEGGKGIVEAGKAAMSMAGEYLKPTETEKLLSAAGVQPGSPQYQQLIVSGLDRRPDVIKSAEYGYPGQPSRSQEAVRNSIEDRRPEAVRLGQAVQDTPGLVDDGLKAMARQKQMEASATTTGTKTAEAQQTAPAALDRAQQALATVAKLRNHPGRYWNTGLPGLVPPRPGSSGSDFVALFDQAKAQAFTQAFDMLRGAGAITEAEGTKGTSAINRLSRGLSDAGFDEALKDYEDVIRTGMARLQKATGAQPTAPGSSVRTPFGTIRQVR